MIRVGFMMADRSDGWLGGVNYRRSLLQAILMNPDRRIEPVLILSPSADERLFAEFPPVERFRAPIAEPGARLRKVGKATRLLLGRDLPLERFLRRHRIDVLSHSGALGRRSSVPSINWIPDFQHRRLPDYFPADERARRDANYARMAAESTLMVLSSADALGDLIGFAPEAADRSRVLHFVSGIDDAAEPPSADADAATLSRFAIDEPFFHLPNQFWAHKNHAVVIAALSHLKAAGAPVPLVLATGKTEDARDPAHFGRLMDAVRAGGIEDRFRPLGIVSHAELHALMRRSVALINPSYFEGWSSTVEEAKSFGKQILLADIPVHREQAPPRGRFFDPDAPAALAAAMQEALASNDPAASAAAQAAARASLPERARAFGARFEAIVDEALQKR